MDAPQLASSFEATINKFDKNFSAHLLDLLARLSLYSTSDCEHSMASVISRWVRHLQAASRVATGAILSLPDGTPGFPSPAPPSPLPRSLGPPQEGVTEAGSARA